MSPVVYKITIYDSCFSRGMGYTNFVCHTNLDMAAGIDREGMEVSLECDKSTKPEKPAESKLSHTGVKTPGHFPAFHTFATEVWVLSKFCKNIFSNLVTLKLLLLNRCLLIDFQFVVTK